MCGRYSIASKLEAIQKQFHAEFCYQFEPVYNAAPSLNLPVILSQGPKKIVPAKWGFVPHWETNINKGYINARGEGIHTAKAFLKSIRERRCLVLANCFYEWGKASKQPYLVHCTDKRIFAFAGIYRPYVNKESGELTNTFAILTTAPNKLMEAIDHHRMPVILKPENYQKWLKNTEPLAKITPLAEYQLSYNYMNAYPVSKLVNSPANNTVEVMEAIGDKIIKEHVISISLESKKKKDSGNNNIPLGERKK